MGITVEKGSMSNPNTVDGAGPLDVDVDGNMLDEEVEYRHVASHKIITLRCSRTDIMDGIKVRTAGIKVKFGDKDPPHIYRTRDKRIVRALDRLLNGPEGASWRAEFFKVDKSKNSIKEGLAKKIADLQKMQAELEGGKIIQGARTAEAVKPELTQPVLTPPPSYAQNDEQHEVSDIQAEKDNQAFEGDYTVPNPGDTL